MYTSIHIYTPFWLLNHWKKVIINSLISFFLSFCIYLSTYLMPYFLFFLSFFISYTVLHGNKTISFILSLSFLPSLSLSLSSSHSFFLLHSLSLYIYLYIYISLLFWPPSYFLSFFLFVFPSLRNTNTKISTSKNSKKKKNRFIHSLTTYITSTFLLNTFMNSWTEIIISRFNNQKMCVFLSLQLLPILQKIDSSFYCLWDKLGESISGIKKGYVNNFI